MALAIAAPVALGLHRIEEACRLLAEARAIDEVKSIRDVAEAARVYARQAQLGLDAQNHAAEIKLRAERRVGELLGDMPRNAGARGVGVPFHDGTALRLDDIGISRGQSHRWQAVATLPERVFEGYITDMRDRSYEITTAGALRLAAEHRRYEAPEPESLPIDLSTPARVQLLVGDVRAALATLDAESVQTVVTSPPYWGLRSYGTDPQVWGGDAGHGHVWRDTGYAGWNPGGRGERSIASSTLSSRSAAARQGSKRPHGATMGEICDCGAWLGELGNEPTVELYVEHMVEVFRAVWRALKSDGTLWLNMGFSYAGSGKGPTGWNGAGDQVRRQGFGAMYVNSNGIERRGGRQNKTDAAAGYKPKDLIPIPWLVAMALQREGWYWRSIIAWCKKATMPESVGDRPTSAWEPIILLSKSRDYFYDADAVKEPSSENTHARRATGAPVSLNGRQGDRADGVKANPSFHKATSAVLATRNMRNVWLLGPEPFPGAHFAVFPTEVPRRCILAGSRPGDLVLDPFAGAGTTSLVAARLGRDSVGIELKREYAEMARDRIQRDAGFTAEVDLHEVTA